MIAPRSCSCGEAMTNFMKGPGKQVYVCHHCDLPCAGVASNVRCDLCAAMKVKR